MCASDGSGGIGGARCGQRRIRDAAASVPAFPMQRGGATVAAVAVVLNIDVEFDVDGLKLCVVFV